jgi:hypothetical protein
MVCKIQPVARWWTMYVQNMSPGIYAGTSCKWVQVHKFTKIYCCIDSYLIIHMRFGVFHTVCWFVTLCGLVDDYLLHSMCRTRLRERYTGKHRISFFTVCDACFISTYDWYCLLPMVCNSLQVKYSQSTNAVSPKTFLIIRGITTARTCHSSSFISITSR